MREDTEDAVEERLGGSDLVPTEADPYRVVLGAVEGVKERILQNHRENIDKRSS
jgi:hypothetical protein